MHSFRLLLLTLLCLMPPAAAQLRIAEFQAANADTIRDEDGQTSDWLEILNTSNTPYSLEGCRLSRTADASIAWAFPNIQLAPATSLLVWCSGKNRMATGAPLHTNFTLPESGGSLWLLAPDGSPLDSTWASYGPQVADRSTGLAFPATTQHLVAVGHLGRVRGAANSGVTGWTTPTFTDSIWLACQTGIGYDKSPTDGNFLPLIGEAGGNVETLMYTTPRQGCFLRLPFTVTKVAQLKSLVLTMRFDDGFAAWINGTKLLLDTTLTNAPESPTATSVATSNRDPQDALTPVAFPLDAQPGLLQEGANVLAIHLMNSVAASNDLLCVPELSAQRVVTTSPSNPVFFVTPTPGRPNPSSGVAGFVDAPDFSVKRGFYQSTVTLTLTSKTPDAEIRFTVDGSQPTATHGTTYAGPLTISSTTPVRAQAFRPGWHPSQIKTHTYLFPQQIANQPANPLGMPTNWGRVWNPTTGELHPTDLFPADYAMAQQIVQSPTYRSRMQPALTETLPVMMLTLPNADLFATNGIYADGRIEEGLEKEASVEFFHPLSDEKFQEQVGLRIHGGHSLVAHAKKPFRLHFRKTYGPGKLRHPLYADSGVTEFDTLQLRPGGHDGWAAPFGSRESNLPQHATYVRDRFLRQTQRDMGQLAPHGRYLHLYLNGLYWGVYDLHEVPNKEYFADHLGGAEADWDVVEHSNATFPKFKVVDGTANSTDSLLALITNPANAAQTSTYGQLQNSIDLRSFIDNMLVNQWGAHNDWVGPVFREGADASRFFNKNWVGARLSRNPSPGRMIWQVWDGEISMGTHLVADITTQRVTDFDLTRVGEGYSMNGTTRIAGPPGELYHALRNNAAFRLLYADAVQRHFFNDGALSVTRCQARLDSLSTQLRTALVAESARWGDTNSGKPVVVTFTPEEHWLSEITWLRETYIPTRHSIMLQQLTTAGLVSATLSPPVPSKPGGQVQPGYALSWTSPEQAPIYYTVDGSDPAWVFGSNDTATPSPFAQIYTQPIVLNSTTRVKARALLGTAWSALQEFQFLVGTPAAASNLVLSEISYNPVPTAAEAALGITSKQLEYLELLNTSQTSVELSGCAFVDGIHFTFPVATPSLQPGQRLVIAALPSALLRRHPGISIAGAWAETTSLNNSGERIELVDNQGQTIFATTYGTTPPWAAAGTSGHSLVLKHPTSQPDLQNPNSWRSSQWPGGSPNSTDETTFAARQTQYGLTTGPAADADGNGAPAMLEYALGLPPGEPHASQPLQLTLEPALDEAGAEVLFPILRYDALNNSDDVALELQASTDLIHWTTVETTLEQSETPDATGRTHYIRRATAHLPESKRQYFRLQARSVATF